MQNLLTLVHSRNGLALSCTTRCVVDAGSPISPIATVVVSDRRPLQLHPLSMQWMAALGASRMMRLVCMMQTFVIHAELNPIGARRTNGSGRRVCWPGSGCCSTGAHEPSPFCVHLYYLLTSTVSRGDELPNQLASLAMPSHWPSRSRRGIR